MGDTVEDILARRKPAASGGSPFSGSSLFVVFASAVELARAAGGDIVQP
jgi:hypothetical protein